MRTKNGQYAIAIKRFAEMYYTEQGISPTVREIERDTRIPRATVQRYLDDLRESGEIEYNGRRGIATEQTRKVNKEVVSVALVGTIACGTPVFAEENISEYFRLPVSLVGKGKFFLLRAQGDSMTEAGIDDGDLVLIRQQPTAEAGQIVAALIDDQATLKRYYPEPENNRVRLHPENCRLADLYVADCAVQGVAVKVLKNLC